VIIIAATMASTFVARSRILGDRTEPQMLDTRQQHTTLEVDETSTDPCPHFSDFQVLTASLSAGPSACRRWLSWPKQCTVRRSNVWPMRDKVVSNDAVHKCVVQGPMHAKKRSACFAECRILNGPSLCKIPTWRLQGGSVL
jgi:hypothetical protein